MIKYLMEKTCSKCKEVKHLELFNQDKYCNDGHTTQCKQCRQDKYKEWYGKNREHSIAQAREWNVANKEKVLKIESKRQIKRKSIRRGEPLPAMFDVPSGPYAHFPSEETKMQAETLRSLAFLAKLCDITEKDIQEVINTTKCQICNQSGVKRKLSVDHCHETMTYRGILCDVCNFALGFTKDDKNLLLLLIQYLTERKKKERTLYHATRNKTKNCDLCLVEKEVKEFSGSRNSLDSYAYQCNDCLIEARKKWRADRNIPRRIPTDADTNGKATKLKNYINKISHISTVFGIPLEESERLLKIDACEVCNYIPPIGKRPLFIDHCHSTGVTRGVLCHSCNAALGMVKDDISTLDNLVLYLEKHQQKITA